MPVAKQLSSLLERDESPDSARPNIDALVSSPIAPNTAPNPSRFGIMTPALRTPQTVSRIMSPREEMHPSKVHSTKTKASQFTGPLSSHPINTLPRSPSKIAVAVGTHRTPNKTHNPVSENMTSPSFDFSFERPESDLSAEAQKIMNSVREEAAKIKAQMVEERDKQDQKDGETDQLFGVGGRQIRKAKGKSGRFSDVHRQEFKKMDSIANHASAWKGKLQQSTSTPLKRSPSKAGFDDISKSLPCSKSFQNFDYASNDRLENTSPSKRTKRSVNEDTSMARPSSKDGNIGQEVVQTTPAKGSHPSGFSSAITTPTKASLARSASVRSLKTCMIPSLPKSASTWTLASPVAPRTEGRNKRLGSWQKFGGNVKSILHRAQPKFSNDPSKVAAGTHLPVPQGKPDFDKDLPSLPGTPTIKRVNFSSSTKLSHDSAATIQATSSSKIPTFQTKQPKPQDTPPAPMPKAEPIVYPDLTASPMITTRAKSPKITLVPAEAATPGDFTFRADKSITFKDNTGFTSPNGTTTIRQVRPSGIPTSMPGAFESHMPVIQHGLTNKKRKHVSSDDDDEERENVDPVAPGLNFDKQIEGDDEGPKAKKQRTAGPTSSPTKGALSPAKRRLTGSGVGGWKGAKKGGLSLSRLNMLARPKERH